MITAKTYPEELSKTLSSIYYQAERLARIGTSEMNEVVLEKSVDLLAAIVGYYTACLKIFSRGSFGTLSFLNQGLHFLVNSAKILFGELTQDFRAAQSEVDIATKEFDQALWDQTRGLILGRSSCPLSDFTQISRD